MPLAPGQQFLPAALWPPPNRPLHPHRRRGWPRMGTPRPRIAPCTSGCRRGSMGSSGRRSSRRSRCTTVGRGRRSRRISSIGGGSGGRGCGSGASAHYLHLCTNKSREWVVVQARFNPGPGVAWQTKASITTKRNLGRVEKFGILPPPSRWPCCSRPCKKIAWGVAVFWGVTPGGTRVLLAHLSFLNRGSHLLLCTYLLKIYCVCC